MEEDSTIETQLLHADSFLARRVCASRLLTLVSAVALIALVALSGCGGGGHSNNNNNNGGGGTDTSTPFNSEVSGTVTDGNGGAIVGASVTLTGHTPVTTSQFGAYVIPNVVVPIGQTSVVTKIQATATVNGQPWSGQNTVEIIRGNALTDNTHLSLSQTSTQGGISGQLTDSSTHLPIASARVFIADGPYTGGTAPNTFQYFTVSSSYTAYTDSNGNYSIQGLPPFGNYTVTASFIGYINQTASNVNVAAKATTSGVNFALSASNSSQALPTVTGMAASAITLPLIPTRAAYDPRQARGIQAIKLNLLQRLGYLKHSSTDLTRATVKTSTTRGTPPGTLIESIIVWDYTQVNNALGFDILRSTSAINAFGSIALLRDPLGDRFADDDPLLTPDTTYYYSVAMVDTINFPKDGSEGNAAVPAVAVEPLAPLSLASPLPGANVSGTPTFSWTAVNRGATYTVMVFSQFPNYQSDTDPNAVQPIWTASTSGTSQAFTGATALVHGQTYYWAVLCQDSVAADFSISPIQQFVQQ